MHKSRSFGIGDIWDSGKVEMNHSKDISWGIYILLSLIYYYTFFKMSPVFFSHILMFLIFILYIFTHIYIYLYRGKKTQWRSYGLLTIRWWKKVKGWLGKVLTIMFPEKWG